MVVMTQYVANTGNGPPRDLRLSRLELIGKATTSLRKNFQISLHKLTCAAIGSEFLEV